MNTQTAMKSWNTLCPPAKIYPIVMSGVVLFNLYRGTYRYALTHAISLFIGTIFLWILCAANLEFAAYALLMLPVLFFVFMLALIFYDQSLFEINRQHTQTENKCSDSETNECEIPCEIDSEPEKCE